MMTWANAELKEISICETANGGKPSDNFDQQWFDSKGALHVNFEGNGNS